MMIMTIMIMIMTTTISLNRSDESGVDGDSEWMTLLRCMVDSATRGTRKRRNSGDCGGHSGGTHAWLAF